jgi:hypothetical protein
MFGSTVPCQACADEAQTRPIRTVKRTAAKPAVSPAAPTVNHAVLSLRPVIRAVEQVFAAVKLRHPDLPRIVVVVATGTRGKVDALGWFHDRRWRTSPDGETYAEITIGAEGLNRGVDDLLNTCLHEAAHALAAARNLKDTSRQGKHHNRVFAAIATELGLTPPAQACPKLGYSECTVRPETAVRYAPEVAALQAAAGLHRLPAAQAARKTTTTAGGKRVKAVCGCLEPRIIYVVASVLARAPIACGLCLQPFEPAMV